MDDKVEIFLKYKYKKFCVSHVQNKFYSTEKLKNNTLLRIGLYLFCVISPKDNNNLKSYSYEFL